MVGRAAWLRGPRLAPGQTRGDSATPPRVRHVDNAFSWPELLRVYRSAAKNFRTPKSENYVSLKTVCITNSVACTRRLESPAACGAVASLRAPRKAR
ncbi:hypothetical protein EVAR_52054_1 [Eumeta japonica]|uniref:Uncharacterized protein n=1 Tax=Eumeta variegata TaxID=151549 RepID=A0A4C1Z7Z1_EUMVA|nr:hypothetical protein EVAR_52054_1 [Eumeta japonica]